jgi:formylmethanofuran dehydrogenase subunit D
MLKINENSAVYITRGEVGILNVSAKDDDGNDYMFQPDDVIRLAVYKKGDFTDLKLKKDVAVQSQTLSVDINLEANDTKIDNIINKPVDYWYEITLNPDTNPHSIICYDDISGAKIFRLYPEGVDE